MRRSRNPHFTHTAPHVRRSRDSNHRRYRISSMNAHQTTCSNAPSTSRSLSQLLRERAVQLVRWQSSTSRQRMRARPCHAQRPGNNCSGHSACSTSRRSIRKRRPLYTHVSSTQTAGTTAVPAAAFIATATISRKTPFSRFRGHTSPRNLDFNSAGMQERWN